MDKVWLGAYPSEVAPNIDKINYHSLSELFDEVCQQYAERTAFENMRTQITFQELHQRSYQFAAFMQQELALQKGDRIALMLPNILQFPIALFAALRLGLVVVNINPLYTAPELLHCLKDSGAKAIVVLSNVAHVLQKISSESSIEHVIVTDVGDEFPFIKRHSINFLLKYVKRKVPDCNILSAYQWTDVVRSHNKEQFKAVDIAENDTAFLQYTGGTTGLPKGAMLSHANIMANIEQLRTWVMPFFTAEQEVVITALPLYHIFSLTVNCLLFMRMGGCNILIANPCDLNGFVKTLKQLKFTAITGVNTLFNALLHHPRFHEIDFKHCRLALAGGMAMQADVAKRWYDLTGRPIIEGYGLTETSPVVTANPLNISEYTGTIGLPLPDTDIKICDEKEIALGIGEAGELCVKGPQVMQGYWRNPKETAEVMQDGFLKTGDIATMDEKGFVRIVDRKKDMILVSGFNVYPNEIEEVIISHPGVLEVAVVGMKDPSGDEQVKAVIVKEEENLNEQDVLNYCRQSLTGYKIPYQVEFRMELPKNNVGKILRRELREG